MTVLALVVTLVSFAFLVGIGSDSIFYLGPLLVLAAWATVRQLIRTRPELEIRADGIVVGTLLAGERLFVPWSEIQDIKSQPMVARGFYLSVGDRSGVLMESTLARGIDDLFFRIFAQGHIPLMTPVGMTAPHFREMIDRRILEHAKENVGLLRIPDREDTI